jgi:general secretion pathway protein A
VLIVDEAHHLSADILEEVRLLTNLETTTEKLLQIVLVGQPELDEKLDSIKLRQLKQRIALRSQLEPLSANETKEYVERRLHVAGVNSAAAVLFPAEAIAAVYRHSRGTPRLINTICENALLTAYAKQMGSVTPEIIDGIVEDFRLNVVGLPEIDREQEVDRTDVRRAAKTLLALYESLQKSRARDKDLRVTVATRLP